MELAASRGDVLAGFEQPADRVPIDALGHVDDAVGVERDDLVDRIGRFDPGVGQAA
jgi:hypothetical protein